MNRQGSESAPIVVIDAALSRPGKGPPLHLRLDAGVHGVVGTPADGTTAIAPVVAGIARIRSGRCQIEGGDPVQEPALRARIGVMLERAALPSFGRVGDLIRLSAQLRKTPHENTLERLGLLRLAHRTVSGLSPGEGRAVELALALAIPRPAAIVLTEPGADISPFDRSSLRAILVEKAALGACVIVATASMNDAVELGGTLHVLERGSVVRSLPSEEAGALLPGRGVELRFYVDVPRLLAAALADDPAVSGIRWDAEYDRGLVVVRGDDLDRLALAAVRAALGAGVRVHAITPVAPGLDEARAAAAGLALAAYQSAYQAAYRPPGAPPLPRTSEAGA